MYCTDVSGSNSSRHLAADIPNSATDDDDDVVVSQDVASSSSTRPSEQGKSKRAHGDVGGLEPPLGAQAQLGYDRRRLANSSGGGGGSRPVAFRALVQHRVSAYVTWPAQLDCDDVTGGVAGYIFRYREIPADGGESPPPPDRESPYAVRNLAVNFVLLDNLLPGKQYRYQVRYVPERGEASAWSQEGELDTSPPPLQRGAPADQ